MGVTVGYYYCKPDADSDGYQYRHLTSVIVVVIIFALQQLLLRLP